MRPSHRCPALYIFYTTGSTGTLPGRPARDNQLFTSFVINHINHKATRRAVIVSVAPSIPTKPDGSMRQKAIGFGHAWLDGRENAATARWRVGWSASFFRFFFFFCFFFHRPETHVLGNYFVAPVGQGQAATLGCAQGTAECQVCLWLPHGERWASVVLSGPILKGVFNTHEKKYFRCLHLTCFSLFSWNKFKICSYFHNNILAPESEPAGILPIFSHFSTRAEPTVCLASWKGPVPVCVLYRSAGMRNLFSLN